MVPVATINYPALTRGGARTATALSGRAVRSTASSAGKASPTQPSVGR